MSRPGALEILDHCETPIGLLCLRRRELLSRPGTMVTEVTLDNEFLMSSYNTISEGALASLAVKLHGGSELRCLVGGLGLGYTAAAALESGKVADLEVVELLPEVIGWLERGLIPLAGQLRGDSRMRLVKGDIYGNLASPPGDLWDLILIDVDHNPGERLDQGSKTFYSAEGLRKTRDWLAPGGVLAVWSSREDEVFLENLRQVFPDARCETVAWWNELIDQEQEDAIFVATCTPNYEAPLRTD
ncbi:MAG: spermidine synthase [Planctomycetota bacterium]|nr:spermidine synthase [Planctomycetota bacterium]